MCSAEDELEDLEDEISALRKKLRGSNPQAVDMIWDVIEDAERGILTFAEMRRQVETIKDLNERDQLHKMIGLPA